MRKHDRNPISRFRGVTGCCIRYLLGTEKFNQTYIRPCILKDHRRRRRRRRRAFCVQAWLDPGLHVCPYETDAYSARRFRRQG